MLPAIEKFSIQPTHNVSMERKPTTLYKKNVTGVFHLYKTGVNVLMLFVCSSLKYSILWDNINNVNYLYNQYSYYYNDKWVKILMINITVIMILTINKVWNSNGCWISLNTVYHQWGVQHNSESYWWRQESSRIFSSWNFNVEF